MNSASIAGVGAMKWKSAVASARHPAQKLGRNDSLPDTGVPFRKMHCCYDITATRMSVVIGNSTQAGIGESIAHLRESKRLGAPGSTASGNH